MRVLIADPDASEHLLMTMAADDWALDREISFATTGAQMLAELRSERPDVIVLDLRLDEPSGFEVLSTLHSSGIIHQVPVVVIADSISRAEHRACLDFGVSHVETRPVELLERASFLDRLDLIVAMVALRHSDVPSLDRLYAAMADDLMHEIADSLGNTPPA